MSPILSMSSMSLLLLLLAASSHAQRYCQVHQPCMLGEQVNAAQLDNEQACFDFCETTPGCTLYTYYYGIVCQAYSSCEVLGDNCGDTCVTNELTCPVGFCEEEFPCIVGDSIGTLLNVGGHEICEEVRYLIIKIQLNPI